MSIIKRGNKWWVDFRFNRKRHRKCSPDNSRAGAKAYEALLRQKLARGEPLEAEKEKDQVLFNEFSQRWHKLYVLSNNKPSEAVTKELILRVHLIPFFGKMEVKSISNLDIEKFKHKKLEEKLNPKTINNILSVLSKCLKNAIEWNIISYLPLIKKLKVPPQKFDFLSVNESRLLLENATDLWQEIILIALRAGLRFGELIALSWEDVDFRRKMLTVKQSIVRGVLGSTKGNKIRYIPLTDEVIKSLESRKKRSGYIFTDEDGKTLKQYVCFKRLHKFCKEAGLRKIGWHTLRHTFASHLAQNGVPLKAIQELLGHSDIATTMRYAHLSPSTLRGAITTLEEKYNGNINFGHNMVTIPTFAFEIPLKEKVDNDDNLPNKKEKESLSSLLST